MSWINLALLSAVTFGTVNIIDSHLISKRMPNLRVFLLLGGTIMLIYSLVLSHLFPLPENTSAGTLLIAVVASIFRAAAVTIMLYAFKMEEVSRIIPVVHTYPIFVAILAMPLLGESLHSLEWLAIIIVVAGAIMVSARQSPTGATTWRVKLVLLLFGSSLLFALADITTKYVLAYIPVWNLRWIVMLCISSTFLLISIRPDTFKQLGNIKQRKSAIGLLALSETLAFAGITLSLSAIEKGPVSLVSTIIGSRPVIVVIFALILSRISPMFLEGHIDRRTLAVRLIATAMIAGGIAIIHLT